ncbi:inositol monophosphatase family protein [Desulforhopalus singaporensis]|nr:inositol monophosphatase family protein [Desulforhopalus singaporensis]
MKHIAFKAGELSLAAAREPDSLTVEFKGEKDLVTAVDRKIEVFLTEEILKKYPGHTIVGEEYGTKTADEGCRWVIDPIDGTVSYVHGLPGYSISLAYQEQGVTRAGVVYGPLLGQMFSAEHGKGASMNRNRLQVSSRKKLRESVLATGFACLRAGAEDNNLKHFNKIVPRLRDVRRMGSAALDLAYVAAGKLDGFWELCLSEYDVAAGVILVKEAGGCVCDFGGKDNFPQQGIIGANPFLVEKIRSMLQHQ